MPELLSESRESQRATSAAGELERHGISKVSVDHFEVGGYRYSNLKDAVAEAERRERKGGAA